jgi:PleD family two-component response regulator
MNGFEFLAHFRSARENHDVPVLIWTIKDLTADEGRSIDASTHGIVKKEVAWKTQVVDEIRALCDALPHPT